MSKQRLISPGLIVEILAQDLVIAILPHLQSI